MPAPLLAKHPLGREEAMPGLVREALSAPQQVIQAHALFEYTQEVGAVHGKEGR